MIIELPDTSIEAVDDRLVKEQERGGIGTTGRVLTLIIDSDKANPHEALDAANAASAESPSRIIVLSPGDDKLDAQIRLGSYAGAGEVIILSYPKALWDHTDSLVIPLLLPDAPVVVWWPGRSPDNPSAHPLGVIAQRRITNITGRRDPLEALNRLRENYQPGDTDLAWTRTTMWRGLLASALDQPPFEPVEKAFVGGEGVRPSVYLVAAWLSFALDCPTDFDLESTAPALSEVRLFRPSGEIAVTRPDGKIATISAPNKPDYRLDLPIRKLWHCLAEELRRVDADDFYGDVLRYGLPKILDKGEA